MAENDPDQSDSTDAELDEKIARARKRTEVIGRAAGRATFNLAVVGVIVGLGYQLAPDLTICGVVGLVVFVLLQ